MSLVHKNNNVPVSRPASRCSVLFVSRVTGGRVV
jgi:hypothetical protein